MSETLFTDARPTVSFLVIDDSTVFLDALRRFLDRDPHFVVIAAVPHGDAALQLPAQPAPQIILLDLLLPDRSGIKLIGPLKARWPQAKIIVLTFRDVEQYRDLALEAGADEFVSKLYVATDLMPAIERVLQT